VLGQEESLEDPERNIVNNLVGDDFLTVEALSKIEIKKGNTILVGTDGLFDNLAHTDLCELVGKGSFEKSYENLVTSCLTPAKDVWKKDDDIAFVYVRRVRTSPE